MPNAGNPKAEVIRGGCPDGFSARANCDLAAQLGLCSMVVRIDNRIITTEAGITTVTRPQPTPTQS